MSEEMKNNLNDEELNKDQLDNAVGGDGSSGLPPVPNSPAIRELKKKVTCPNCGNVMVVPALSKLNITCNKCGADI